jgi:hypothetical protein
MGKYWTFNEFLADLSIDENGNEAHIVAVWV